jgi:hypothetical protein
MKNTVFFVLLAFIVLPFSVDAQRSKQNRYMFEKFVNGKVLMKNKGIVNTKLNYDWISQEINYYNNEEKMILTGLDMIDTVYIADRKFIPYGNVFLEVIPINGDYLFINWKMNVKNKGREGPMGTTSHAVSSQQLDVSDIKGQGITKNDLYIYDATFDNTYYLRIDNKFKMFNSEKSFLKLFPKENAEKIRIYIKKQKLDMKKLSDVIILVDHIFELD